MRFFIALLFALFTLFAPAFAQPGAVTVTASLAPTVEENSLLWRITGKELSTPSYLYGTIHLIGKDDFFLTDSTLAFLEKSQKVTFEINMEELMNLPAQLKLMMKSFMDGGKTLRDLLSADDYALVKKHFDKMGLPLFLFERMKPMFLTVFASLDMSPNSMSTGDMVSYEMKIMDIAKQQKKKIGGLETAEYQMSMFDSIPYETQAQMLVESIKSNDAGSTEFDEMVQLYKNQDINGMVAMMRADEDGIGSYEDLLLVTRNKNWIPVMGEMMMKQPTFFAVGAGHLGGEMGVVALLRSEGYTVEPVR